MATHDVTVDLPTRFVLRSDVTWVVWSDDAVILPRAPCGRLRARVPALRRWKEHEDRARRWRGPQSRHQGGGRRLLVGGDDVPWSPRGRGRGQRLLVGLLVLVEVRPLGQICRRELPLLGRIVEARQEPPALSSLEMWRKNLTTRVPLR